MPFPVLGSKYSKGSIYLSLPRIGALNRKWLLISSSPSNNSFSSPSSLNREVSGLLSHAFAAHFSATLISSNDVFQAWGKGSREKSRLDKEKLRPSPPDAAPFLSTSDVDDPLSRNQRDQPTQLGVAHPLRSEHNLISFAIIFDENRPANGEMILRSERDFRREDLCVKIFH